MFLSDVSRSRIVPTKDIDHAWWPPTLQSASRSAATRVHAFEALTPENQGLTAVQLLASGGRVSCKANAALTLFAGAAPTFVADAALMFADAR